MKLKVKKQIVIEDVCLFDEVLLEHETITIEKIDDNIVVEYDGNTLFADFASLNDYVEDLRIEYETWLKIRELCEDMLHSSTA